MQSTTSYTSSDLQCHHRRTTSRTGTPNLPLADVIVLVSWSISRALFSEVSSGEYAFLRTVSTRVPPTCHCTIRWHVLTDDIPKTGSSMGAVGLVRDPTSPSFAAYFAPVMIP